MVEVIPPVPTGAGGVFRSLLPQRSVEDILAGRLPLTLGKTVFPLEVLTIEKADEWRVTLASKFGDVVSALESQTDVAGVLSFLGTNTPTMLELIHQYDVDWKLPDDEWIRSHATEPEVLRGFVLILAACFPFIASALDILAANPGALGMVLSEFGPQTLAGSATNTSPEPTAGPSKRSARRSRTNNSTAT